MARLIAVELGAFAAKATVYGNRADAENLEDEVSRRVAQDGTTPPTLHDRLATLDLLLRDHPDWAGTGHLTGVAWPGNKAAVHRLVLPFTDEAQIAETLPFAVEAEVPFDLEDMVLAWRKGEQAGEVLATLVRTADLGMMLDGLAERELDPRRVFTDGDVLAAYARFDDTVTAVIDVGHEHTSIVVARAGRALLHRSIDVAGRTFTRVIQDALGCTWAEAQALKHGDPDEAQEASSPELDAMTASQALHDADDLEFDIEDDDAGEPTPTAALVAEDPADAPPPPVPVPMPPRHAVAADGRLPEVADKALDGAIGLLLAEIRTTLVQAEDDLGVEIGEIVLGGGGARVPKLADYLGADLGLEVVSPTDAEGGPVPPGHEVTRALAGMILGDEQAATDLRVGELAFRGGMDTPRLVVSGALVAAAIFLLAVVGLSGWQYREAVVARTDFEAQTVAMVAEVVEDLPEDVDGGTAVGLIGDLLLDAQAEAEFVGDPAAAPPTVHLLHRITTAFPPHPDVKVDVDRLEITPAVVSIEGVTDDFPQVDQIAEALKTRGGFEEVDYEPGGRDKKGRLEFSLSASRLEAVEDTDVPLDEEG